ncbi:hypothetical protein ONZ51_g3798 [Trametes cubensis]|uniref:Peptidase M48 domain-containing protein n=1 Tax=Trametes cubensis TaxID=1111947 RepID=A0AAD7TXK6_9APHY|nr:hypothetical protein ONZ51_g3798 [Trametes cubensis]
MSSLSRLRCIRLASLPRSHAWTPRPQQIPIRAFNNYPGGSPRYVRFDSKGQGPHNSWDVRQWNTPSKVMAGIGVFAVGYYVSHLEQVPETGRWRFMDISPKFEATLAEAAHQQMLQEFKGKVLPPDHPLTRHIRRVVTRILEANNLGTLEAPDVHTRHRPATDIWAAGDVDRISPEAGGKEWHLFVVNDDKVVNAMASFGNIVVFTGILPVAKDENGLAAVLGHEIGHAVARHASERYSSMKVFLFLSTLLDIVGIPFSTILTRILYDLPNSRAQEFEGTDKIGLRLSSRACFDPEAVPEMFKRLGQLERAMSGRHIDFLTTHPASEKRSEALREMLPEAYTVQAASPMCEKEFVYGALKQSLRLDGRAMLEMRTPTLTFGPELGWVECSLGKTRVLAQVDGKMVKPPPERPLEGMITIHSELSSMASNEYEPGRASDQEVTITRMLDKALRRSDAVDKESLCVLAGQRVWHIRLTIHILSDAGNMLDCACLAGIVALKHFRRPEVEVVGDEITIVRIPPHLPPSAPLSYSPPV